MKKPVQKSAELLEQEHLHKLKEDEAHYQFLLEKYPPNKKFYSYAYRSDSTWRRVEEIPTPEMLVDAERWTGNLIGGLAGYYKNFVVTGILMDSRVLEFEYMYVDKRLVLSHC